LRFLYEQYAQDLEEDVEENECKPKRRHLLSLRSLLMLFQDFELTTSGGMINRNIKKTTNTFEDIMTWEEVTHLLAEILELEEENIHVEIFRILHGTTTSTNISKQLDSLLEQESATTDMCIIKRKKKRIDKEKYLIKEEEELFVTFAEFREVLAALAMYYCPDPFVPVWNKIEDFLMLQMTHTVQ
jgi:hypothetical protein